MNSTTKKVDVVIIGGEGEGYLVAFLLDKSGEVTAIEAAPEGMQVRYRQNGEDRTSSLRSSAAGNISSRGGTE